MTTDEIIARMTEAQKRALRSERWDAGDFCSYRLRIGMNTLTAMRTRGLVERHASVGSMFSPQTNIRWPLTAVGKAVRARLMEKQND